MKMQKVTSGEIIRELIKRHRGDMAFAEVKNGATGSSRQLRSIDFLAIKRQWTPLNIIGYEVKVSRGDFLGDEKWYSYLDYCHTFSFVAPKGMIKPEELPEYVGLVEYNLETKSIRTVKKAHYRQITPDADMLLYLMFWRMKVEDNRYNFTEQTREDRVQFWRDWLDGKVKSKDIGNKVSRKLDGELREAEGLKIKFEKLNEFREEIQRAYLQLFGSNSYGSWQIIEKLKGKSQGINPKIKDDLVAAKRKIEILIGKLESEVEVNETMRELPISMGR